MAHPFRTLFDRALDKSTADDNLVLIQAEKLLKKGYRPDEIHTVLHELQKSLIDTTESEIVAEAVVEFSRHIDG